MNKTILVFAICAVSYFLFQSSGEGVTSSQLIDRTNSPVSDGSCFSCHGGGMYNSSLDIKLLDKNDSPVTKYFPLQNYKVVFTVNATGADKFGVQGTLLTTDNSAAGILTANSLNTKTTKLGGRTYLDHTEPSTSNVFIGSWKAPAEGTGKITIYANAIAADGSGNTEADQMATSEPLEITEGSTAGINSITQSYAYVYPNPAISVIRINSNGVPTSIELFDLRGNLVKKVLQQNELNLIDVVQGVYIARIINEGIIRTEKVIIN